MCCICRYGSNQTLFHQFKLFGWMSRQHVPRFHITQLLCYWERWFMQFAWFRQADVFFCSKLTMPSPRVRLSVNLEERGLLSRTAAGNRAHIVQSSNQLFYLCVLCIKIMWKQQQSKPWSPSFTKLSNYSKRLRKSSIFEIAFFCNVTCWLFFFSDQCDAVQNACENGLHWTHLQTMTISQFTLRWIYRFSRAPD